MIARAAALGGRRRSEAVALCSTRSAEVMLRAGVPTSCEERWLTDDLGMMPSDADGASPHGARGNYLRKPTAGSHLASTRASRRLGRAVTVAPSGRCIFAA